MEGESWTLKKAECPRIDAFELWCWRRLLRVPWTAKRSNESIKRNQAWIFTGRTDAHAEVPIVWPPDVKSWLTGRDLDTGKDWRQEEKGTTEDEMVGWPHRLDGHEFKQTQGDTGQRSLACCSLGVHRVRHDWTTNIFLNLSPKIMEIKTNFKKTNERGTVRPPSESVSEASSVPFSL